MSERLMSFEQGSQSAGQGPSPRRSVARTSMVLCALILAAAFAPAQAAIQLSDGLPFSDVSLSTTLPQFSPDGQYVVYRQDAVTDGAFDLWSARVDGSSAPVLLSQPLLATQGQFMFFAISPDSERVVYAVDQDTTGKTELYSVRIDGVGAVTKLNLTLASDRDVIAFRISPTSDRVIYSADAQDWTDYGLFSVPITGPGNASVQLNPDLSSDSDVDGFQISPDGDTVIYRRGRNATDVWNLYGVASNGGEAVLVNGALPPGAKVWNYFLITPDSNRVVYLADSTISGTFDLFSVSLSGGGPVKLSTGVSAGFSIDPSFLISPDGARVVFRGATVAAQAYQLFSVPVTGGTVVRLNGALQTGEDVEAAFAISADSSKVVYRSDEDVNDVVEVYSVPVAGGTPTRLNPSFALPVPTALDVLDFAISPDSTRVVYRADQNVDTLNELFSVPIGGGTSTKLNRSLASGGDVQNFRISPNGLWVIYGADQDADTVDELLGVPITGGTVLDLSGPLASGGDVVLCAPSCTASTAVAAYDISSTSLDVLYAADETSNDQVELYDASLGGPPSAPTAVVATPGNTQVTVTFAVPASNGGSPITGYTVTPNPATVGWVDSNAGSTATTHLITNLTNGTAYTFTVRATNVNGTGAASAPSNSVTPATVPSAPSAVAAVPRNFGADVTFAASASNGGAAISGYTVISNPPGGIDLSQGTTALTHYVVGLTNGTPYTFTVVAQNAMGPSPASAASSAVTPGCAPEVGANLFCDGVESSDTSQWSFASAVPGAPTSVVAAAGNAQATVTFVAPIVAPGNAVTGYTVTSNPPGGVDSNAGAVGLSHVVTGLTNGTAYTFTVRATNTTGEGPASAPSNSVTPATVPEAPTGVVAVAGDSVATVVFVAPLDDGGSPILGYTVTSTPAGGVDTNAGQLGLTHAITGLANGTEYTFTVKATNAAGTGADSKPSNPVTPSPS